MIFQESADEAIDYIKKKVPEAKSVLDKLVSALSAVNNSEEMGELITFLKNDIVTHANFLKEPVRVSYKFTISNKNYGSAMTPFYTVLSLWVCVLFLTSLLTTEVHGDYKPYEVYLEGDLHF